MSIVIDNEKRVFTLRTKNTTYQMMADELGGLVHLYYGSAVDGCAMDHLVQRYSMSFAPCPTDIGMLRNYSFDYLPLEYSSWGSGDYRTTAVKVTFPDGSNALDLRYDSHKTFKGKTPLAGLPAVYADEDEAETLEITLKDRFSEVYVVLSYCVLPEFDAIARSVKVINRTGAELVVNSALSAMADFRSDEYDLLTFGGRWARERNMERIPVHNGKIAVESRRGASSHHQNPFIVLCDKTATEDQGCCYGLSFIYSGSFTAFAETDQMDQTRLAIGLNPDNFNWKLDDGETFQTPEAVFVCGTEGFGSMSRNFHKLYREHLCRGKYKHARRPILINNWEATYFKFDEEKLFRIAEQAQKLGVEMLVMDDGWFGKRENDHSGLGDWFVNEQKLKGGLNPLVERINSIGMKFGIWFEPEMISEDSDLYRAHPDWCLHMPGREPLRSRIQLTLDMSRADVRDYLYERLYSILSSANIAYVKWDMNRSMAVVYSMLLPAEKQGEVYHRYILGLYELLERIESAFPDVLFEGCSGGGGRFDPGMLYYHPQIWCSDDSDAIERLEIQYGTSFCYPVSTMGAHVSAVPNHQTGRVTPLNTRGVVAMSGTFGYEMDLGKMTEEEKEEVKVQIETFKKYYDLISYGDYYRLSNPAENHRYTAWEFVSEDKKRALLNYVSVLPQANPAPRIIKLRGLDPDTCYEVEGLKLTGAALMQGGILMPVMSGDHQALQMEIRAL
ncbi:MAG: alpha-galactosidase [Oscillospiraceae bacterium]|nr:alpha-galactosidase [Oscillospiraceae bacterium]